MSNKYRVLEILKGNNLTIKQIHERITFTNDKKKNQAMIRSYIHRLKEKGLVREVTRDKKWVIYTATEIETQKSNNSDVKNHLKFLNDFFKNNLDYLSENEDITNFVSKNKATFNKIEELISNA